MSDKKTLIIHDLDLEMKSIESQGEQNIKIISANKKYARCRGCFGCWLKTPGACVIRDGVEMIGKEFLCSDHVIIISKNLYGGFSIGVKRMIDRCIPGVLPFFKKKNGEMHHKERYDNQTKMSVYFYDCADITEEEKELAGRIVRANAVNFNAKEMRTIFFDGIEAVKEVLHNENITC